MEGSNFMKNEKTVIFSDFHDFHDFDENDKKPLGLDRGLDTTAPLHFDKNRVQ